MWLCVKFRLQEYYIFSLLLPKQCKFTVKKKKNQKQKQKTQATNRERKKKNPKPRNPLCDHLYEYLSRA